ncbi:MAG: hypothetical protein LBQ28_03735 [Prevotellaceae bacterium]|nr:hypothetical protein [Prevotellaceae bacterium]
MQELLKIGVEAKKIGTSKSKLIFPKYRNDKDKNINDKDKKRISEQEARFLFVRELENPEQTKYYYSVETPTEKKYRFPKKKNPKIDKEKGRSGSFDICLYEKFDDKDYPKRTCFIEFKALSVDKQDISKDFLKLICDQGGLTNYFVHIIKNSNSGTYSKVESKYNKAIDIATTQGIEKSELKIFLCDIGKKEIYLYEVDKEEKKVKSQKIF